MFKFLFLIFLFIILIGFLLGFSILRGLKRILFGSGPSFRQQNRSNTNQQRHYSYNAQTERKEEEPQMKITRKMFEAEKGEYVDFEEVKD